MQCDRSLSKLDVSMDGITNWQHVNHMGDDFYICTVHSRYEDFFIKIQMMHSL